MEQQVIETKEIVEKPNLLLKYLSSPLFLTICILSSVKILFGIGFIDIVMLVGLWIIYAFSKKHKDSKGGIITFKVAYIIKFSFTMFIYLGLGLALALFFVSSLFQSFSISPVEEQAYSYNPQGLVIFVSCVCGLILISLIAYTIVNFIINLNAINKCQKMINKEIEINQKIPVVVIIFLFINIVFNLFGLGGVAIWSFLISRFVSFIPNILIIAKLSTTLPAIQVIFSIIINITTLILLVIGIINYNKEIKNI